MFTVERLEERTLMAANVTQSGGTLTITGDNSDDAVLLVGNGTGEVEVFVDTDGDGSIDSSLGTFTGVQNIKLNTKGGDDAIGLEAVEIAGSLDIKTGGGGDGVIMGDMVVGGATSLNTGAGSDLIFAGGEFAGAMNVKTGGGNDVFLLFESSVSGKLDVNMGGGDDLVAIDETSVTLGGAVSLNGAGGDDLLVGDAAADLEQQLDQLGASVKRFEESVNVDDLPPAVNGALQAEFVDLVLRLTP
jgi:hypothetical protein